MKNRIVNTEFLIVIVCTLTITFSIRAIVKFLLPSGPKSQVSIIMTPFIEKGPAMKEGGVILFLEGNTEKKNQPKNSGPERTNMPPGYTLACSDTGYGWFHGIYCSTDEWKTKAEAYKWAWSRYETIDNPPVSTRAFRQCEEETKFATNDLENILLPRRLVANSQEDDIEWIGATNLFVCKEETFRFEINSDYSMITIHDWPRGKIVSDFRPVVSRSNSTWIIRFRTNAWLRPIK